MPQKLQEEAQSKKDQMDQSVQKISGQGIDGGELLSGPNVRWRMHTRRSFWPASLIICAGVYLNRTTLWSSKSEEICHSNTSGSCGAKQVIVLICHQNTDVKNMHMYQRLYYQFLCYSGGNEEGGGNQAQTTGSLHYEQVSIMTT